MRKMQLNFGHPLICRLTPVPHSLYHPHRRRILPCTNHETSSGPGGFYGSGRPPLLRRGKKRVFTPASIQSSRRSGGVFGRVLVPSGQHPEFQTKRRRFRAGASAKCAPWGSRPVPHFRYVLF